MNQSKGGETNQSKGGESKQNQSRVKVELESGERNGSEKVERKYRLKSGESKLRNWRENTK